MIRLIQKTDIPDIIALLNWMDEQPQREVFAPLAREPLELEWECEDSTCWVKLDDTGELQAYCASTPFKDGLVLEGPLSENISKKNQHIDLVNKTLSQTEGLPVYAFCSSENMIVREILEQVGLMPMHTTEFFEAPLKKIRTVQFPEGFDYDGMLDLLEYRDLYRAAEQSWSERLEWSPEQYDEHFAREDILFLSIRRRGRSVGFIEAELQHTEGRANVSYLCVHPADRGHKLGRVLISLMVKELGEFPNIKTLRARAHDHSRAARALYEQMNLKLCRSVMTYMQEAEEEA